MKQVILKAFNSEIVDHISTTWELASDSGFLNVIDSITNSVIYRDTWFIDISQLPGETLYIRAKRIFDSGEDSDWIHFSEVLSSIVDINYTVNESGIELPMLLGSTSIDMDSNEIQIMLSSMRSSGLTHVATNYIIKKFDGTIVYKNLQDEVNKTTITINITEHNITPYEPLVLFVAFINSNRVQSEYMKYIINPQEVKVYPTYPLIDIIPSLDYNLKITNPNDDIYNLYIKDVEKGENIFEIVNTTTSEILIPRHVFAENKSYVLTITNDNNELTAELPFVTRNEEDVYNLVDSGYELSFETIEYDLPTDHNNFFIEGIDNKIALFHNVSNNSFIFSNMNKKEHYDSGVYTGLPTTLQNTDLKAIKLDGVKIGLLGRNNNNITSLSVVTYNASHYIVSHFSTRTFPDITINDKTGFNSVLFNGYNKQIYFIGEKNNVLHLYKYDYITDTLDQVVELLEQDYNHYTLTNLSDNRLLITASGLVGSDTATVYIYNIKTNTFNNIQSMLPEYVNARLASIRLRDGNILFVDTLTNGLDYLLFNISTLSFTIKPKDTNYEDGNNIVVTENGSIFINKINTPTEFNYFGQ